MPAKNHRSFFFTAILCSIFTSVAVAQSASKDIKRLTKAFSKAYNATDHAAISAMFITDTVRLEPGGKVTNGAGEIGASYAQRFSNADPKADSKMLSVKEETSGNAVSNGTYALTGTVKANGEEIAISGACENTHEKENGKWKIRHIKSLAAK